MCDKFRPHFFAGFCTKFDQEMFVINYLQDLRNNIDIQCELFLIKVDDKDVVKKAQITIIERIYSFQREMFNSDDIVFNEEKLNEFDRSVSSDLLNLYKKLYFTPGE
jgi:hypothetical protein